MNKMLENKLNIHIIGEQRNNYFSLLTLTWQKLQPMNFIVIVFHLMKDLKNILVRKVHFFKRIIIEFK